MEASITATRATGLLTPDDVTQPWIRGAAVIADRVDFARAKPSSGAFYVVLQSLRRATNCAYDCPCAPDPTQPPEPVPKPEAQHVTACHSPCQWLHVRLLRVGEDSRDALLEALGFVPYALHGIASAL